MNLIEINFDGIIGPSHNYAGLSLGNVASASNAGRISRPREAALQGLDKMRANMALGLAQGWFMPLPRPNGGWLRALATDMAEADDRLIACAFSASAMWAANAATVSPGPDTRDGACHMTVANLVTMPHRSHEWPDTLAQLRCAFPPGKFTVHPPIPAPFGDEGAANHMRIARRHGEAGVEIFVYGRSGGAYPARQHEEASRAVARRHGLDPRRVLFIEQAPEAIAAGAFHNDVVAVANEHVLFTHEQAFADRDAAYAAIRDKARWCEIVEVPASAVSLSDAIASYLFNAQLVTLPDDAGMALVVPTEALATPGVASWLETMQRSNGPIRQIVPVDVRQSMANGGGPACLRLRVVADPKDVDPRFLCSEETLDKAAAVIARHWPEEIAPQDLTAPALASDVRVARQALLSALILDELG